jgi:hypothetical protein
LTNLPALQLLVLLLLTPALHCLRALLLVCAAAGWARRVPLLLLLLLLLAHRMALPCLV